MKNDLWRPFNEPAGLVLSLLLLFGLAISGDYARKVPAIDYYVAWTAAQAVSSGTEHDIYTREGRYVMGREYRRLAMAEGQESRRAVASARMSYLSATGSPFLYSVVALLSNDDYDGSLNTWHTLSLLMFVLGGLAFAWKLRFSWAGAMAMVVPCLFWLRALQSDLRVGNFNSIQLGLLGLLFLLMCRPGGEKKEFAVGAATALLVMLKINMAPVALLVAGAWVLRGDKSRLLFGMAGAAAGTLLAWAVSSWYFGDPGIWLNWFQSLFGVAGGTAAEIAGNYTLAEAGGFKIGPLTQIVLMVLLCGLMLYLLYFNRSRSGHPHAEAVENAHLLAFGCMVQVVISPMVWLHYYVLVLPMLCVLMRPWTAEPARPALSVTLDRVLPGLLFMVFLGGSWIISQASENFEKVQANIVVASVVVLLLLLLKSAALGEGRKTG